MHWLKLLKNNLNQHLFKSKHLRVSYLEVPGKYGGSSLFNDIFLCLTLKS